ncbi:hypothetical protein N9W55_02920 [Amylibacter sp.]|nr:hypothetical protein [Amylibacter sp.]
MKLMHTPFLLVLLGITQYTRDIMALPFYGSRIFIFNLYLLLFGLLLYMQSENQRKIYIKAYIHFLNISKSVVFIWASFIFLFISTLSNILNDEQDYFLHLQLLSFIIGFIYFYLIIFNDGIKLFLRSLSAALWVLLIFQSFIYISADTLGLSGEIVSKRNGMAYVALFFFILHNTYSEGKGRKELLLVVLLALINQTNGVMVLIILYFLNYTSSKTILRFKTMRFVYPKLVFIAIVLASYYGLYVVLFYIGISENELNALEAKRYYIPDNIGSMISRLGSVPFTVETWIQTGNIFGLGPREASKLLYWGYPVHNYFASLIAISGLLGILFSYIMLSVLYKVSQIRLMLGISGLFFLSVSNDLTVSLVLCLAPLILYESNPPKILKI